MWAGDWLTRCLTKVPAVQRRNREWSGRWAIVGMMVVLAVAAPSAVVAQDGGSSEGASSSEQPVRVGTKTFTESVVLGEIVRLLVRTETGRDVRLREQLGGSRVLWSALTRGDIDVYPEYTGTIDEELFATREIGSREAMREALGESGIEMTEPLGFSNTYAIGMRKEQARELGIETVSDLKEHPDLTMGFSNEFLDRADGWKGLRRAYNLPHEDVQGLDHDLAYQGLDSGSIDVIDLYSTDAEIEYYDLKVLEDDRDFFPKYEAVLLYRSSLAERAPAVTTALKRLEGKIDAERMRQLNKAVKIDGRDDAVVARDFIQQAFGLNAEVETVSPVQRIWERTLQHLWLVGVSLMLALLLAIPLGIVAAKVDWLEQTVLGVVGIVQTIPSLALLVFMIPLFGIGARPAIAALFVYSLLPVVRNTHAGLADIPRELMDSARALGMSFWSRLWRIELPLALRPMFAGIKTAAVINVGVATLGALIGAGGYGQPILTGIRLDDFSLILEGAIPAAGLALVVQGGFDLLERLVVSSGLKLDEESV